MDCIIIRFFVSSLEFREQSDRRSKSLRHHVLFNVANILIDLIEVQVPRIHPIPYLHHQPRLQRHLPQSDTNRLHPLRIRQFTPPLYQFR